MNENTNLVAKIALPFVLTASVLNWADINYPQDATGYYKKESNNPYELNFQETNSGIPFYMNDFDKYIMLRDFSESIVKDSIDLDIEIAQIVNDNFYELL